MPTGSNIGDTSEPLRLIAPSGRYTGVGADVIIPEAEMVDIVIYGPTGGAVATHPAITMSPAPPVPVRGFAHLSFRRNQDRISSFRITRPSAATDFAVLVWSK